MKSDFPDWYANRGDVEPRRCRIVYLHETRPGTAQAVIVTPLSFGIDTPHITGTWQEVNRQIGEWMKARLADAEKKVEEARRELDWCEHALHIILNRTEQEGE